MNNLELLIDQDILDVAYLVFKKKLVHGKDEQESFIQMVKECILIHLSKLESGILQRDVNKVVKELYDVLNKPNLKKEEEVLNSVCLSYRHDFGLLTPEEQSSIRFQATEWLTAWRKHLEV